MCSGYFPTHLCDLSISHTSTLKTSVLCIGLNIYFKDVHTGHLPIHLCCRCFLLGISLHICPKDVYSGYFAYTSLLKMCIGAIYPHIYAKHVYWMSLHICLKTVSTRYFPTHLSCAFWAFLLSHLP